MLKGCPSLASFFDPIVETTIFFIQPTRSIQPIYIIIKMSSNPVIPIRYYHLMNEAIGIEIWPEIRAPGSGHTEKIWDGRNHTGFDINVGM